MIFCGQCGQQLAPGDVRCSRCGAAIEPDASATIDNAYPNAPTESAPSFSANRLSPTNAPGPTSPPPQPNPVPSKLVLRANPNGDDYSTAAASDATSMMDAPMMGGAYPTVYPQQSATNYPPAGTSPGGFPPQGPGGFTAQGSYTGFSSPSGRLYTPVPTAYPGSSPYQQYQGAQGTGAPGSRGRSAALVIILIGLLFILSAIVLFILQHNGTI